MRYFTGSQWSSFESSVISKSTVYTQQLVEYPSNLYTHGYLTSVHKTVG